MSGWYAGVTDASDHGGVWAAIATSAATATDAATAIAIAMVVMVAATQIAAAATATVKHGLSRLSQARRPQGPARPCHVGARTGPSDVARGRMLRADIRRDAVQAVVHPREGAEPTAGCWLLSVVVDDIAPSCNQPATAQEPCRPPLSLPPPACMLCTQQGPARPHILARR